MKQRISVDQLTQLSPGQQEKLRAWWKLREGDWLYGEYISESYSLSQGKHHERIWFAGPICESYVNKDNQTVIAFYKTEGNGTYRGRGSFILGNSGIYPLLSIGQCIELLESHDQCINIVNAVHGVEYDSKFTWQIHLRHLKEYEYDTELIDSLWKMVKSIL